jgi:hypothetical protein
MRLFDFVEEHHAIRSAADGFGELTAFLVADISGRRAEETADRVLFAILRHVNAHERFFIIEHEPGESFCQFGLANTRRTDEDEGTNRAGGVFQPGACAADGIGDGMNGFFLTDDALMQTRFHVQEFFDSVSSICVTGMPVH